MADLTDALNELLAGQTGTISRRIDADEPSTQAAMQAAIPALLAALGSEADNPGLRQAIERDHDGSILDQLSEYLGGTAQLSSRTTNGAGILEHMLGGRQGEMAQALSAKSGLSLGSIMQLLPLLAPILMGMLGKRTRGGSGGGGGFSFDDLGSILGGETEAAKGKNPDIGDILDSFGPSGSRSRTGSSGRSTTSTSTSTSGRRPSSRGGLGGLLDSIFGRTKG
jgi:hypothetical protein